MAIDNEHRKKMLSHIECWQASGLNKQDYCRQEHLDYNQFYYWYQVSRGNTKKRRSSKPGFVPLVVTEKPADHPPLSILVSGSNGLVASIPAHDSCIALLRQLLKD